MIIHVLKTKRCSSFRGIVLFILNAFIITTIFSSFPVNAYSLTELSLPKPTQLISTSPMLDAPCLQGIKFYFNQPFRFDFIIDEGQKRVEPEELRVEASRLIKYFLASLTIPEDDLWVNLSPYERDVIIPDELGHTVLGEDLLGEDYILKQLMASLTYPENPLGKKFWEKVYQKAYEIYGTTEIPINTFNKIWIVPDRAVVYEEGDRAVIGEARLKVMMEEDYFALRRNLGKPDIVAHRLGEGQVKEISNFSSSIMKEVVLPIIEGEVNHGKNFAYLRQIYNSLILAVWFKNKLKESILGQIYVDQKKIKGINAKERQVKEKLYTRYLAAYERGAYNYIRTDYDTSLKKDIQRRYFSGGVDFTGDFVISSPVIPEEFIEKLASSRLSTTEIQLVATSPPPTVFARARSLISSVGRLFRRVAEEEVKVEEKVRPATVSSPLEVAALVGTDVTRRGAKVEFYHVDADKIKKNKETKKAVAQAIVEVGKRSASPEMFPSTAESYFNALENFGVVLTAEGGEIVGFLIFSGDPKTSPVAKIDLIASRRGRGVGTPLMNQAMELFRNQGFQEVTLTSVSDQATQFYQTWQGKDGLKLAQTGDTFSASLKRVAAEAERVKRVAGVEEVKAITPAVFITEAEEEVVEPAALAVAEEAEWRKEIERDSDKIKKGYSEEISDARHTANAFLAIKQIRLGEGLIELLVEKGVPFEQIPAKLDPVFDALEDVEGSFKWFEGRIAGKEKYLLGGKGALAGDVIDYLNERGRLTGEDTILIEYILRGALENINELSSQDIAEFTNTFLSPRLIQNPLDQALRAYVNYRVAEVLGPDIVPLEASEQVQRVSEKIQREEKVKLFFACAFNSERSAISHVLAEQIAQELGRDNVEVDSGGIVALAGTTFNEALREVSAKRGVDARIMNRFSSQNITNEQIEDADIIFVSHGHVKEMIERHFPQHAHKIVYMSQISPSHFEPLLKEESRVDIEDYTGFLIWGGTEEEFYDAFYNGLKEGVFGGVERVAKEEGISSPVAALEPFIQEHVSGHEQAGIRLMLDRTLDHSKEDGVIVVYADISDMSSRDAMNASRADDVKDRVAATFADAIDALKGARVILGEDELAAVFPIEAFRDKDDMEQWFLELQLDLIGFDSYPPFIPTGGVRVEGLREYLAPAEAVGTVRNAVDLLRDCVKSAHTNQQVAKKVSEDAEGNLRMELFQASSYTPLPEKKSILTESSEKAIDEIRESMGPLEIEGYTLESKYPCLQIGIRKGDPVTGLKSSPLLERLIQRAKSQKEPGTYWVRAPPDTFYLVIADGKGGVQELKFLSNYVPDKESTTDIRFQQLAKASRRAEVKTRIHEAFKFYGFKSPNDAFGPVFGDDLIALINLNLYLVFQRLARNAFAQGRMLTHKEIFDGLAAAAEKVDSSEIEVEMEGKTTKTTLRKEYQFRVFFEASAVSTEEGLLAEELTTEIVDRMAAARATPHRIAGYRRGAAQTKIWLGKQEAREGHELKWYAFNKDNMNLIETELSLMVTDQTSRAEKVLRENTTIRLDNLISKVSARDRSGRATFKMLSDRSQAQEILARLKEEAPAVAIAVMPGEPYEAARVIAEEAARVQEVAGGVIREAEWIVEVPVAEEEEPGAASSAAEIEETVALATAPVPVAAPARREAIAATIDELQRLPHEDILQICANKGDAERAIAKFLKLFIPRFYKISRIPPLATKDMSKPNQGVTLYRRYKFNLARDYVESGGFGTVYKARDTMAQQQGLSPDVAVKILRPTADASLYSQVIMLLHEAAILREMSGKKGVIGFRDIGYVETTAGTQYFLVMDYAEGEPLSVVLDRKHILSEQEARDLAGALLRTFLLLEREGISHLDIKPENIIIPKTSDGKDDFKNAKLIDFGNALRTDGESREGVTIATPSYAPPETWPRGEASLQRDLYSLGMVLYHGVEGIIPHEITPDQDMFEEPAYEHPSAILERRKKEEAPPLVRKDVSEELRGVIAWMVKKEVEERPASAEAVLNRLGVPEEVIVAREAERVKAAVAAVEKEAIGPAVALEVEEEAASSAAVMEEEVAEEITTEEFEELKTAGLDGEVNWLRPRVLRAADGRDPEIVYYPAMRFDIYRALNITNAEKIVGVDPLAGVSRRDIINNFIRELERLGVKIRPLDIKIKGVSLVDINGKTTRRIRYEVAFDYKDKVRSIIIYQADANQFTPDTLPETEKGYDMHYTYGWSPKASALERSLTGLNEGGVMMFHIMPQDIEERINYDELAARDDFGEADEALWRGRDIFGNEYEHRIVLFAKTGVEKEAPLPVSVEEEIVREGMPVVTPIREAPRPGRGGIDLGPMEIETRGEGLEISLESLPFDLKTFEGFTFQILKLERVDDVGRLLGHVDKEEKEVSSLPAP